MNFMKKGKGKNLTSCYTLTLTTNSGQPLEASFLSVSQKGVQVIT